MKCYYKFYASVLRQQNLAFFSLDAVFLLMFPMSLMTAHVVVTRFVVPWLSMMSSPIRNGHSKFSNYFDQWVVVYSHSAV